MRLITCPKVDFIWRWDTGNRHTQLYYDGVTVGNRGALGSLARKDFSEEVAMRIKKKEKIQTCKKQKNLLSYISRGMKSKTKVSVAPCSLWTLRERPFLASSSFWEVHMSFGLWPHYFNLCFIFTWHSSSVSSPHLSFVQVYLCFWLLAFYNDTSHIGIKSTLMTSL